MSEGVTSVRGGFGRNDSEHGAQLRPDSACGIEGPDVEYARDGMQDVRA